MKIKLFNIHAGACKLIQKKSMQAHATTTRKNLYEC